MSFRDDPLTTLWTSRPGKLITRRLGLPSPPELVRHQPGIAPLPGPVLLAGSGPNGSGRLVEPIRALLHRDYVLTAPDRDGGRPGALVFDATGIADPDGTAALREFFAANVRSLADHGRVLVIGSNPKKAAEPVFHAVQRGLEGFVRSVAKELGGGSTAHIVYVDPEPSSDLSGLESTLRFLLSRKSAYLDSQVIRVGAARGATPADWRKPLEGRVAVVTGAAQGIGAAIAEVFVRDGGKAILVDVPQAGDALRQSAEKFGGIPVTADVTAPEAASVIAKAAEPLGGVDVLVNNAGITRDKLLANMDEAKWRAVIAVNLKAPLQLANGLVDSGALGSGGAVVHVSSIAGLAGNRGQTNYATTKAGVLGLVDAYTPVFAEKGITVNAIAPGFIKTPMTAAVPFLNREIGARINTLLQWGLPVDVAEAAAYLGAASSNAVTGNVVRVCGQMMVGS